MGLGEMHPENQREDVVGIDRFPQKAARAYTAALYSIRRVEETINFSENKNPVILDLVHAEERDTGDRIILCSMW